MAAHVPVLIDEDTEDLMRSETFLRERAELAVKLKREGCVRCQTLAREVREQGAKHFGPGSVSGDDQFSRAMKLAEELDNLEHCDLVTTDLTGVRRKLYQRVAQLGFEDLLTYLRREGQRRNLPD